MAIVLYHTEGGYSVKKWNEVSFIACHKLSENDTDNTPYTTNIEV